MGTDLIYCLLVHWISFQNGVCRDFREARTIYVLLMEGEELILKVP